MFPSLITVESVRLLLTMNNVVFSSLNFLFFFFFSEGTTEATLIEVLTQRSNYQRQLIAKAYEKATGRVTLPRVTHTFLLYFCTNLGEAFCRRK